MCEWRVETLLGGTRNEVGEVLWGKKMRNRVIIRLTVAHSQIDCRKNLV